MLKTILTSLWLTICGVAGLVISFYIKIDLPIWAMFVILFLALWVIVFLCMYLFKRHKGE